MNVQLFIFPLLAAQFAAFGWRINREINVGDDDRRTWLPLPDWVNLGALLIVVLTCVVLPLARVVYEPLMRAVLAGGYVLIALHPLAMAAHYRLFWQGGRSVYLRPRVDEDGEPVIGRDGKQILDGDYPWITAPEAIVMMIVGILATGAALLAWEATVSLDRIRL